MLIDSKKIVTMTEANQNFSKVAKLCEENGSCVIFRNNKPKFALLDLDTLDIELLEADDNLEELCKRHLDKSKWL